MDWLKTEILTGFQKLLCLGLERTPAESVIDGTALAWMEVIGNRFRDVDVDRPRIREAFRKLAETRRAWPAPADFLEVLPAPPKAPLSIAPPANPERAKAAIAEAAALLGVRRG